MDVSKLNPEDIEFNPNPDRPNPGAEYKSGYIVRKGDSREMHAAFFWLWSQKIWVKRISHWHLRLPEYRISFYPDSGKIVLEKGSKVLPERGLKALQDVLARQQFERPANDWSGAGPFVRRKPR